MIDKMLSNPTYFIMGVAILISLILTLVNMFVINQKRMKEINSEVKAYNKKLMKATRKNNQEELDKLKKKKPQIMQLQQELMKMQMPMFLSMLPFFVVFLLLRRLAEAQAWGEFLLFPWCPSLAAASAGTCFALPLFGASLGWLGWYIVCSMPFTSFFRKLLGVQ